MFKEDLKKIPVTHLFLEMFIVVLAVLLALGVNEWRENRRNQELVRITLESIKKEIIKNQYDVKQAHQYHLVLLEKVPKMLEKRELTPAMTDPNHIFTVDWDGIFTKGLSAAANVSNIAWQSAHSTNAIHYMDFQMVNSLSKVYILQNNYLKQQNDFRNSLTLSKFLGLNELNFYRGLLNSLNEYRWDEKKLLKAYEETLKNLKF